MKIQQLIHCLIMWVNSGYVKSFLVITVWFVTSCSSVKSPAVAALENWLATHENNYTYCIIIPGAGCEGCILGTEYFAKKYYGRDDILFVFTRIETLKLLKHKLGKEAVDKGHIIFDTDNEFEIIEEGINNIYPVVCKIENNEVKDILYVSPEYDALSEVEKYIKRNPVYTIALDSYFSDSESNIEFSEIVDSIEYIPLNTPLDLPVDIILSTKIAGDNIFVLDRSQKLYRFDRKGNYLNLIGNRGEGPDEYLNVVEFDVDVLNENIYLYDIHKRKIFIFNFLGKFNNSISIPDYLMNVTQLNDSSFVGYKPFYLSDDDCERLIVFNEKGKEKNVLVLNKIGIAEKQNIDIFRMADFRIVNKEVYFKLPFENTMYTMTIDNDCYKNIGIEMGKYLLPNDVAINTEKYNKHLNFPYIYELKCLKVKDWVFINFIYEMENYRVLYNLLNKEFYTISKGKYPEGITDNINEGFSFWPIWLTIEGNAIGITEPLEGEGNPILQLVVFK